MYVDKDMPGARPCKIYEEGRAEPIGLVVAIDTDEGYVLEYRKTDGSKIESVWFKGELHPKVYKRYGKFRIEGYPYGTL